MAAPAPSEAQLKEVLKEALLEALEERSDLLRDLLAEVFEDVALAHAIREGEASATVSRDEVFRILDTSE